MSTKQDNYSFYVRNLAAMKSMARSHDATLNFLDPDKPLGIIRCKTIADLRAAGIQVEENEHDPIHWLPSPICVDGEVIYPLPIHPAQSDFAFDPADDYFRELEAERGAARIRAKRRREEMKRVLDSLPYIEPAFDGKD